jgi:hypothetical protein
LLFEFRERNHNFLERIFVKDTIAILSSLMIVLSIIPYAYGTYYRKIKPNLVSWSIWSIVGLALLLTYKSSGAKESLLPIVFGFLNPVVITGLAVWRGEKKRPEPLEIACVVLGIATIVAWAFVRDDRRLSSFALGLGLIADACAAIPTIVSSWKSPKDDRPFMWLMFALGYGLAMFTISEHNIPNYALPVYMVAGSCFVAFPLIRYRINKKIPVSEWI